MQNSGMKIYIGYDSLQTDASDVCEYSIHKHSRYDIDVSHLKQQELRDNNLYWRNDYASTEFSYTRFLIPHLESHNGWAMFCDSDFLFTKDVSVMFNALLKDKYLDRYSCFVVRHKAYEPKAKTKFFGHNQEALPKKNWSSLILFNCGHEDCKNLTPLTVNNRTPQWLHRFEWTKDSNIGMLDVRWNWLVGDYPEIPEPWGIHFTNGGPFNGVHGQDYEDIWYNYFTEMTGLDYKKLQS